MIARILFAAILAGVVAGVFVTGVQAYKVTPLIHEAETYEGKQAGGHDHAAPASEKPAAEKPAAEAHDHGGHDHGDGNVWAPGDGFERLFFTLLSNILTGVAFGLLLTAAVVLTGGEISLARGTLWGICGYAAVALAPSVGLPPELPGMPAADLTDRQVWWWSTVVLTAGGLGLMVLQGNFALKALGLVLIVAPHIVGAPQPVSHESAVPAVLASQFAAATLAVSALFWVVLGASAGWFLARADQTSEA